jgi:hypothetical protein
MHSAAKLIAIAYLPHHTISSKIQKLRLEIIPQGTLNHISIETTLHDRIIMAQLHDEGVKIIKAETISRRGEVQIFSSGSHGSFMV